jgi:hypothetical protein
LTKEAEAESSNSEHMEGMRKHEEINLLNEEIVQETKR